jgi:hypothetical protein
MASPSSAHRLHWKSGNVLRSGGGGSGINGGFRNTRVFNGTIRRRRVDPSPQSSLIRAALFDAFSTRMSHALGRLLQEQRFIRTVSIHQNHQRSPEGFNAIGSVRFRKMEARGRGDSIGVVTTPAVGLYEDRVQRLRKRPGLSRANGRLQKRK